jgi:nuclear transport factor 2 (NTF2) superfamily protein
MSRWEHLSSLHKNERAIVLVDGKERIASRYGYLYSDSTGQPMESHRALSENWRNNEENFWVLTGGHVYVFNYNPGTISEDLPLTPEDYE